MGATHPKAQLGAAERPVAAALALQTLQPPFHHPPYTISSHNSHHSGHLEAREVAGGGGRWQEAAALPWTSPLLLSVGFLGTFLELRTNCNYFPR